MTRLGMWEAPAQEDDSLSRLAEIAGRLSAGGVLPYLGPGMIDLLGSPPVPTTPQALALALNARVAVSGRLRGNLWSTAQFIESRRHRKTLTGLMASIFAPEVTPTPLHRRLAALPIPLIVDTWYDGAMRAALVDSGRRDWGEIQGVTRSLERRDVWTKAYDAAGVEVDPAAAASWTTVLYKPHGAITPAQNFVVSDSDYVEVLTEIDIQTPIPLVVQQHRAGRSFLYLGVRFDDQMLRTFARQIAKRSSAAHAAVLERGSLTRKESRFCDEAGIEIVDCPLQVAAGYVVGT